MQRYGAFRVSVSNLPNSPPPPVTLSDWNAGASCHSCQRRAGLVSRSFHQTTGAYIRPRRLMHYTFTSCLISASPPGSATARINCVSNICHIGASLEKMDESEMSRKVCLKGDSSGNLKLIFLTHLFQAVGVWRFEWFDSLLSSHLVPNAAILTPSWLGFTSTISQLQFDIFGIYARHKSPSSIHVLYSRLNFCFTSQTFSTTVWSNVHKVYVINWKP